jgi:polyphenol oxidase
MIDSLIPSISNSDNYLIAFSTKSDGNMLRTNESRIAVHENRLRFIEKNGIDQENLFTIRTSHSPNVELIDREPGAYVRRTFLQKPVIDTDFDYYYTGSDGALTFDRNLFIGLMSGDCVPVVLWDSVSGLHGILHVGLLGALNHMVGILPRIFTSTGVKLANTSFYLGPSITQRNYNVSESGLWLAIASQARARISNVDDYIHKNHLAEYFDIQSMILDQLLECGVRKHQIQKYEHCVADPDSIFFSHNILKQNGEKGNFFSVIGPKTKAVV